MASEGFDRVNQPKSRPKRVTAQQTLERVRNNQRRHRAHRKDYIATLEQKLSDAEQSISSLQETVDALRAEVVQLRSSSDHILPHYSSFPEQLHHKNDNEGVLFRYPGRTIESYNIETLGPISGQQSQIYVFGDFPEVVLAPGSSQYGEPGDSIDSTEPGILQAIDTSVGESISDIEETHTPQDHSDSPFQPSDCQLLEEAGISTSTMVIPDSITTKARNCCSKQLPSKSGKSKASTNKIAQNEEELPSLLQLASQTSRNACYQEISEEESTILCTEAYPLIAQQNFKGISDREVVRWLWTGFRTPGRREEGCRVRTDLLFSLLEFVSDS